MVGAAESAFSKGRAFMTVNLAQQPIAILGRDGMLGRALCEVYGDVPFVATDREVDITDREVIHQHLSRIHPSVVINAVAYNDVNGAEEHSEVAMRLNAEGPFHLAKWCQQAHVPLVHVSTSWVFDGEAATGYRESDAPHPINAYARSKLRGEQNVLTTWDRSYVIRTDRLYGAGTTRNIVDTFVELGRTVPEIRAVDNQWGSSCWSQDLARAIRLLLDDRAPFGVYHLANEGRVSWYDLAVEVVRILELPARVTAIDRTTFTRKARVPQCSELHNTKRPALRPWKEAIQDYLLQKR